jgi:hypothetical protein
MIKPTFPLTLKAPINLSKIIPLNIIYGKKRHSPEIVIHNIGFDFVILKISVLKTMMANAVIDINKFKNKAFELLLIRNNNPRVIKTMTAIGISANT